MKKKVKIFFERASKIAILVNYPDMFVRKLEKHRDESINVSVAFIFIHEKNREKKHTHFFLSLGFERKGAGEEEKVF